MQIRGVWYFPQNNGPKLRGVFTYDDKRGPFLEVEGSFEADDNLNWFELENVPIILGETSEGLKVTLYHCVHVGWDNSAATGLLEQWTAERIFTNIHVAQEEELRFVSSTVYINNLYSWLDQKKVERNQRLIADDHVMIKYSKLDSITFKIDNETTGQFNFFIRPVIDRSKPIEDRIYHSCIFKIANENNNEISFNTFITLQGRLVDFLKTVTGENCATEGLAFLYRRPKSADQLENADSDPIRVEVYSGKRNMQSEASEENPKNFLFTYSKEAQFMPGIIERWFGLYDSLEEVLGILADRVVNETGFRAYHFKETVQALEAFHRKMYVNERMPKAEYSLLRQRILEQITNSDDRAFIAEKLLYGNEPSLKNRLNQLIGSVNIPKLNEFIGDKKNFLFQIVENRNYLTHLDKAGKKGILTGSALHFLNQQALLLLYALVLNQLFENEEVVNRLVERAYRMGII